MGNWAEVDKIRVCALKLTEAAREFYSANPELREPGITWQDFKTKFLTRFRDVRTNQYHYSELHKARQRISG
jgi:hypothetical protein